MIGGKDKKLDDVLLELLCGAIQGMWADAMAKAGQEFMSLHDWTISNTKPKDFTGEELANIESASWFAMAILAIDDATEHKIGTMPQLLKNTMLKVTVEANKAIRAKKEQMESSRKAADFKRN